MNAAISKCSHSFHPSPQSVNCVHLWAWLKGAEWRWKRGDGSRWVLQTDTTCQTLHLEARLTLIPALLLLSRSSLLSLKTTFDKHLISTLNIAIIKGPPITGILFIIPLQSSPCPVTINLFSLYSSPSVSLRDVRIPVEVHLSPGINLAEI